MTENLKWIAAAVGVVGLFAALFIYFSPRSPVQPSKPAPVVAAPPPAEEDVIKLAAAMDPGSTAGVLIWENLWAAPFASAARRSGGQLVADGRIPIQSIIASIEADENATSGGD